MTVSILYGCEWLVGVYHKIKGANNHYQYLGLHLNVVIDLI